MPLAGYEQEDIPTGASIVAGIGLINGVECMITANIPTLAGGAINEVSVQKSTRIHEICLQNRLPCINFTQSAGANLAQQFRVFHPGGASFRHLAERSKANIPTATVVFGSSTAG
jgi:acetyl-CoA carboxylase carboxyltransferase component